jgi:DNA uptake protein ComE-like DNA-binding protein
MMDLLAKKVRWRLPRRRTGLACAALACVAVFVPLMNSPVLALVGDLAAITKASNLDSDPQDFQAVTAVCTTCHAASQFLSTPRSSSRWEQVFEEMSGYGANGTDDQLDRVVAYFQKNLTVINVNTSPPEDLKETLQISDQTVLAVMARRTKQAFAGIDDLAKLLGVDRPILEKLKAKNCLQF